MQTLSRKQMENRSNINAFAKATIIKKNVRKQRTERLYRRTFVINAHTNETQRSFADDNTQQAHAILSALKSKLNMRRANTTKMKQTAERAL